MRIVDLLKKESIQFNAAPNGGSDVHFDVLARLITVLMDLYFGGKRAYDHACRKA